MTKRLKNYRKLRAGKQACLATLLVSAGCIGVLGDTSDGSAEVVGAAHRPAASETVYGREIPAIRRNPFIVDEPAAEAGQRLMRRPEPEPNSNPPPLQPATAPAAPPPVSQAPPVSQTPQLQQRSAVDQHSSVPAVVANRGLRSFPARLPTFQASTAQRPARLPVVSPRPAATMALAPNTDVPATRLPQVRRPAANSGRLFSPGFSRRPAASMVSQGGDVFELNAPVNHPQPYGASAALARMATGEGQPNPSSPSDLLLPAQSQLNRAEDLLAPVVPQQAPAVSSAVQSNGLLPAPQQRPYRPPSPGHVNSGIAAQPPQDAGQSPQFAGSPQPIEQLPTPAADNHHSLGPAGNPGNHPQPAARPAFAFQSDFSPTPVPLQPTDYDASREQWVYDEKHDVPTQRPLIEWGRLWYSDGITPPGINLFGATNMVRPKFWVYGDYRQGIITGQNAGGRTDNAASQLNLDFDFWVTDSERFHMFVQPFNKGGQVSNIDFSGDELEFNGIFDVTPVTGFFEGDLGAMIGGIRGTESPMEIPVTIGLVPLLFQNGIWMEDAVTGAAFSLAGRHSRALKWSNYDATFFAAIDQINSPAFLGDEHAAQAFGTAWFIEAYNGYIETGYAYLNDRNNPERSYHNSTFSYTARYLHRFSSSLRVIINSGQDLPKNQRTADGALVFFENSLITAAPLTFVPYYNFFAGFGTPQSVARAGASGGVLRNVGLNFDTDGINGLANLNATGADSFGGAIGVDLIGDNLDRQLVLEAAYVSPQGSGNAALPDDQFGLGARYQFPISNATLLRFDAMYGWRRGLDDVFGTRFEYRWKF